MPLLPQVITTQAHSDIDIVVRGKEELTTHRIVSQGVEEKFSLT